MTKCVRSRSHRRPPRKKSKISSGVSGALNPKPRLRTFEDITRWWLDHPNPLTYQQALGLSDELYRHFLSHSMIVEEDAYRLASSGLISEDDYRIFSSGISTATPPPAGSVHSA